MAREKVNVSVKLNIHIFLSLKFQDHVKKYMMKIYESSKLLYFGGVFAPLVIIGFKEGKDWRNN